MSKDITKAVPLLYEFWHDLEPWYLNKFPGRKLILTHVDRTPVEQLRLFCQGRLPENPGEIVTWKDGFVRFSKHNYMPARAFDVAIIVGGHADWRETAALGMVGAVEALGYAGRVRWGVIGAKDYYHFEVI